NEAIQRAVELVNGIHEEFLGAIDECERSIGVLDLESRGIARQYIEGLRDAVAASYHWQVFTDRYRHDDHFFQDFK
ncbi:MAG: hypothetical protein KDK70_15280, partial [Myxococcales bacterium]|nr:hypothetical protein [Myxococcales bacterium]